MSLFIKPNKEDRDMLDIFSKVNKNKNRSSYDIILWAVVHEDMLDKINLTMQDLENSGEIELIVKP